jgi:hypothetical protein
LAVCTAAWYNRSHLPKKGGHAMAEFLELGSSWVNLDQVTYINVHVNKAGVADSATIHFSNGRDQTVSHLTDAAALHVVLQQHKAK